MNTITETTNNSGILITSDVLKAGYSKSQFYKYIREHQFDRVAHGIYASPEVWVDENYILSLRYPNAVFSHDEALYYHGLIDREPQKRTLTVYTGYGVSRLIKENIKVYTIKKELLNVGKMTVLTSFGNAVSMYNAERAICDLVRGRGHFEIQDYQTALKTYAAKRDKDLNRLMRYAKLFHVDCKIREYMGVLL